MHTEHDAPNSDVNPESIKQGHEADNIDVRTILYVPIVLVISFALTWGVVTLIINNIRLPSNEPVDKSLTGERNQAPLPDRLGRISSTDPKADVKQARLEGAEILTTNTQPWVQSSDPTKDGNSAKYAANEMRPSSALGKKLGLQDYGWKDKEKNLVRIPIEEAMKILAEGAKGADQDAKKLYAKVLKFEDKVNVEEIRATRAKASNPFWGMTPPPQGKEETKEKH